LLLLDPAQNFGDGHRLCIESYTQIACLLRNSGVIVFAHAQIVFLKLFRQWFTVRCYVASRRLSFTHFMQLWSPVADFLRARRGKHPRARLRLGQPATPLASSCGARPSREQGPIVKAQWPRGSWLLAFFLLHLCTRAQSAQRSAFK
jgi:hypothetical protein